MQNLRGTNVTIFLLFFGLTLLEAVQTRDWLRAAFWLAIGFVFLTADGLHRER
jgi:hypothetical protein